MLGCFDVDLMFTWEDKVSLVVSFVIYFLLSTVEKGVYRCEMSD